MLFVHNGGLLGNKAGLLETISRLTRPSLKGIEPVARRRWAGSSKALSRWLIHETPMGFLHSYPTQFTYLYWKNGQHLTFVPQVFVLQRVVYVRCCLNTSQTPHIDLTSVLTIQGDEKTRILGFRIFSHLNGERLANAPKMSYLCTRIYRLWKTQVCNLKPLIIYFK